MSRHFNWEFIGNVIEIFKEEFLTKEFLAFLIEKFDGNLMMDVVRNLSILEVLRSWRS